MLTTFLSLPAMSEKSKIVAVFIYDGTEKYSTMTVNAIKSFLAASQGTKRTLVTPVSICTIGITVGILVPPTLRQPDWTSILGSSVRSSPFLRYCRQYDIHTLVSFFLLVSLRGVSMCASSVSTLRTGIPPNTSSI